MSATDVVSTSFGNVSENRGCPTNIMSEQGALGGNCNTHHGRNSKYEGILML